MKKLIVDFSKTITRNANYSPMQLAEGSMAHSLSNSVLPGSTKKGIRFELRSTDPSVPYGSYRAEITVMNNNSNPDANTPWLAFNTFIKSGELQTGSKEIIFPFQFHDRSISQGTGIASPSFAMEILNGRFRAAVRWSVGDYNTSSNRRAQWFDLGPVVLDTVQSWLVYYVPHVTAGKIRVWLNGAAEDKPFFKYDGPCQFVGSQHPFLKIGIYGWNRPPLVVGYIGQDLIVGDGAETFASMTGGVIVTPPPVNKVPVVQAVDMTGDQPEITLSGSATDPDGTIAGLLWAQKSGPGGAVIESPTSATTKVTGLVSGTYVFSLTATDNQGASTTDDCTATIDIPPPAKKVVAELYDDGTWKQL